MFTIQMLADFALGATAPVTINGQDQRLHWSAPDTLKILPADPNDTTPPDARKILIELPDLDNAAGRTFYCSDR